MKSRKIKTLQWTIVITAIVGSLIWMLSSGNPTPEKKATVSQDAVTLLTVAPDDYIKGKVDGQVTLVEYVDFECEACAAFFPLVKQLEKDFSNDLQIVIRYFPLPGHRNGMPAALAVEAAGQQGKFFEMHDLLYTEQKKWGEKPSPTPEVFEAYAQQLGLDMEKFKAAVNSPETKARVERDIESGKALGNTGTPSFYLNGKKLQPNSYDEFKKAVQTEIDASKVEFGV
jgi:protein-disulfide isomerase